MTPRDVSRARLKLRVAGAPADHEQIRLSLSERAAYQIAILQQQLDGLAADFRRFLAAWLGADIPPDTAPYVLLSDTRIARLYGAAALAALVGEMLLAAWFFHRNDVDWRVGMFSVVVITLIFHASIFYMAYGSSGRFRPHETMQNLSLFVWPASVLFFVAVLLAVVPRYLQGPAAASQTVQNWLSAGLVAGTLSMLVLASALACAHHIYATTSRYTKRYQAVLLELRMTEAFASELERLASSRTGSRNAGAVRSPSSQVSTGTTVAVLLAVLSLPCAVGCAAEATGGADAPQPAEYDSGLPLCETELDTSGSLDGLDAAWNALRTNLVAVTYHYRCSSLLVSRFDSDGWRAAPMVRLALPSVSRVELPPLRGEWTEMKNAQEARQQQLQALQNEAERHYREQLVRSLAGLDRLGLPPNDHESTGSDIVGAIRRYSQYDGTRLRLVILLSDLGDTRYRTAPHIPPPSGNIRVLALVCPMKAKDARLLSDPASAAEQYDRRAAWLRSGSPWVVVAPFFSVNLVDLLADSARATQQ